MSDVITKLASLIVSDSISYDLNFLIIEQDGIECSKFRIDDANQVINKIEKTLKRRRIGIEEIVEYEEDKAIEFSWFLNTQHKKEINLYMI